jgi:hypothetical protein
MTAFEQFEHKFWMGIVSDAEGTLRRVRSLREELRVSIAVDKILGRFYPGAEGPSTMVNEGAVAMIDRLLGEYDSLDEVPF